MPIDSRKSAHSSGTAARPRILRGIDVLLKLVLVAELAYALWEGSWLTAAAVLGILVVTLLPWILRRRFHVALPYELEIAAIVFIFSSLFLGEVHGYYTTYRWWDSLLHASSGLLLGIFGFLLVHAMNESDRIGMNLRAGLVAFFSFLFALGVGTVWEIFEFAMDSLAGTNMQKPMLGDPSGLTDTMWDLILDATGALTISLLGYAYLKTPMRNSFLEKWILDFIRANPGFFPKRKKR